MSIMSKEELRQKRRVTGMLGFVHITTSIISGIMLGYPYISFVEVLTGEISELNIFFVLGGLALYLVGLGFAVYSFYIDRKPFNIEHPTRRRHISVSRFMLWLFIWTLVTIFIIGFSSRYNLSLAPYWIGSINDFVLRYVFMLGAVLMFMGFIMMFIYSKIIPDKTILKQDEYKKKLIYIGILWSLVIIVFTFGVFLNIPLL